MYRTRCFETIEYKLIPLQIKYTFFLHNNWKIFIRGRDIGYQDSLIPTLHGQQYGGSNFRHYPGLNDAPSFMINASCATQSHFPSPDSDKSHLLSRSCV